MSIIEAYHRLVFSAFQCSAGCYLVVGFIYFLKILLRFEDDYSNSRLFFVESFEIKH